MNDANEAHIAASALAAFQLTQAAFAALVRKGILSKTEAEEFLRQATDAIKADGPGARAAELLADALEKAFQISADNSSIDGGGRSHRGRLI